MFTIFHITVQDYVYIANIIIVWWLLIVWPQARRSLLPVRQGKSIKQWYSIHYTHRWNSKHDLCRFNLQTLHFEQELFYIPYCYNIFGFIYIYLVLFLIYFFLISYSEDMYSNTKTDVKLFDLVCFPLLLMQWPASICIPWSVRLVQEIKPKSDWMKSYLLTDMSFRK